MHTLVRADKERVGDLQEQLVVLALHLGRAERLQRAHCRARGIGPLAVDERQLLHRGPDHLDLIVAEEVVEQERRAFDVHLDGHDDDAADEGHVLGHAVVERHGLERQREAGG